MSNHVNGTIEKQKLLKILGIDKETPDEEVSVHYKKIRKEHREQMLNEKDFRERARLQNLVIAIDDAYFEYKDSIKRGYQ